MTEMIIRWFVRISLLRRLLGDRRAGTWDLEGARRRDAARRKAGG